jgi:predicted AlkP superfamily phosphohydrolase/phosphomutase
MIKKNKTIIFGIDGAAFELIKKWKSDLPNISKLIKNGVHGRLESTMPPVTCPAWPCMFTGKNPGKLDMYYFVRDDTRGKKSKITTSSSYHSMSLWKILNDHKIDVGLLNVAMTFPPHKVNSFMVCGTGTPPSSRAKYTYPEALQHELEKVVPGYEPLPLIDLTIPGKEEENSIALLEEVNSRTKAAKYLIKEYSWKLFITVFFASDSTQHYFWHYMDEEHPKHKKSAYGNAIKDIYKQIDTSIGEITAEIPDKTNIFVVSDHGFGPQWGCFDEASWLESQGLLTLIKPTRKGFPLLWRTRKLLLALLGIRVTRWIAKIVPENLAEKISDRQRENVEVQRLYNNIDWSKTKIYPQTGMGLLRINLKGREPEGIVNTGKEYEDVVTEVMEKLNKLYDPYLKEPVTIRIHRGEDIYKGPFSSGSPDIAFYIERYLPVPCENRGEVWNPPRHSGWHSMDGSFIASGPDIKGIDKCLENLKIYDITPTILHMFGVPISADMDGRVLTEIFKEDSEPGRRKVVYSETNNGLEKTKQKIKKLKSSKTI